MVKIDSYYSFFFFKYSTYATEHHVFEGFFAFVYIDVRYPAEWLHFFLATIGGRVA